jgi:hypothetical protein
MEQASWISEYTSISTIENVKEMFFTLFVTFHEYRYRK